VSLVLLTNDPGLPIDEWPRVAKWYIFIPKIPVLINLEDLGVENVGIF
jgi:hypothetical protein